MKCKGGCFNRITVSVLAFFLLLSAILILIFWLEELLNLNNSVINALWLICWDIYPVWISVIIGFANMLCAVTGIQLTYKSRKTDKKSFRNCLFYAGITLALLVVHCITADYIFGSVIASV